MNKFWRWILAVLSVLGIVYTFLAFSLLSKNSALAQKLMVFLANERNFWTGLTIFIILLIIFAAFAYGLFYAIYGGKFKGRRSTNSDYGVVEIGSVAIENIALNAAKTAQAGIKNAKARVSSDDENSLNLTLDVTLYSDVEIPQQMRKIQERVKKDIEKYTGIAVSEVRINVKKVEVLGTVVER
ncbi:alkaline shock response membrane anchor protein AmaP [Fastidiosipila sanguinis]|nr:alkaline shock response membrane anchor protein AmaP [Fastidiosipila sanguinis]